MIEALGRGEVSMPVRAFLDSDTSVISRVLPAGGFVSMPVRAFLDSDLVDLLFALFNMVGFNARQGIS